jgi:hypothetical protein
MDRRRFIRATAIGAAGTAVAVGGYWAWGAVCRAGLAAGCQSDNLSVIAKHLEQYAAAHDGRLPPVADLLAVARGPHDSYLWCPPAALPYQWDLRATGQAVAGLDGRPVVWCPPGGHGPYVGAIVATGGDLRAVGVTVAELRRLVGGVWPAEPGAAPDRGLVSDS